jgi:putative transposase
MTRRRNSLRLRGFDYAQDGAYFVTMCTNNGVCIFGRIEGPHMLLSQIGAIVDSCWRQIPVHFPNVKLGLSQIMPNYIHGIISIKDIGVGAHPAKKWQGLPHAGRSREDTPNEKSCRGLQLKTPTRKHLSEISPKRGSLGVIIRTFKGAVTSEMRKRGKSSDPSIWQRSFHDHVIRDEIEQFFIEQYIELNPLMWYLDQENPDAGPASDDELRNLLQRKHGLDGQVIDRIIQYSSLETQGRYGGISYTSPPSDLCRGV